MITVKPSDLMVGCRDEVLFVGEGLVREVMLLEIEPAPFNSGAYFGNHSTVSQDRSASALVVFLLVWMEPWSMTSTRGWVRCSTS